MFTGDRDDMSLAVDRVEIKGEIPNTRPILRYLMPYTFDSADEDEVAWRVANQLLNLTYLTAERRGHENCIHLRIGTQ